MSKYCIDSRDFRDELTQLLTTTAHDDDTEYTRQRFQKDTARAILLMFQSILKMITDTNEEVQASRKQYERIVSEIRILETMFQTHLQSVPSTQQTAPDPPHFNTYLKVGVFDGIPFKICLVHDIDEKSVLPFKAVVFRRSPGASFQRLSRFNQSDFVNSLCLRKKCCKCCRCSKCGLRVETIPFRLVPGMLS